MLHLRAETTVARPRSAPARAFRDHRQRAAVCRTLLARVGLREAWSHDGPRPDAIRSARIDQHRVWPRTLRVLLLCFAIWDETAILAFSDVFQLAGDDLAALGDLLSSAAHGPAAIDAWIVRWDPS